MQPESPSGERVRRTAMTSAANSTQSPPAAVLLRSLSAKSTRYFPCGGDARAALRALVLANAFFEAELEQLTRAVSIGFTRGQIGD